MRLGLGRVRRLLTALGDPQLAVSIILVAGTNGKGSTSALLANICRTAGYRTGLYVSPHLESVTERVTIDGSSITDRDLAQLLEQGIETSADVGLEPPTHFEALTVAAFLYFRDSRADLAIMEVGLGGRFDATNASEPELSIITSIGLDHERHLGNNRESIAKEKCGILRHGRPAIAWAEDPSIEQVLRAEAEAAGAKLSLVAPSGVRASKPEAARPQCVKLETPREAYDLELPLAGHHQLSNLSLAVRAAEVLLEDGWNALDRAAIIAGIAGCHWPGRLEWVALGDSKRVLLDGAHNAAGIEALANYLDHLEEAPDLLFGALAEKSISGVLPRLASKVDRVTLTSPPNDRAATPEHWQPIFGDQAVLEADLGPALDAALGTCRHTLLICGSLFLVGRCRGLLRERFGVPE